MNEKTNHHPSFSPAYVESTIGNEQMAKGKSDKVVKKCRIHVHSKRKRLCDVDGLSIKAYLDGLRDAGIFPNDTTQFIKEVTESQELSKVEETIITVEWEG